MIIFSPCSEYAASLTRGSLIRCMKIDIDFTVFQFLLPDRDGQASAEIVKPFTEGKIFAVHVSVLIYILMPAGNHYRRLKESV